VVSDDERSEARGTDSAERLIPSGNLLTCGRLRELVDSLSRDGGRLLTHLRGHLRDSPAGANVTFS
jgi:hypothetical protein